MSIELDMKVKYLLLMLVLGVILVTPIVGAEFRTITVDGLTGDWAGIPPFVTDPQGDYTSVDPSEDIKAVYVANDDVNLYFWMEIYEYVDPVSTQTGGGYTGYVFYIDILPGSGCEENGGADFKIVYYSGVVELSRPNNIAILYYWEEGIGWEEVDCEGVQGAMNDFDIEVSVPWECIGGKRCFESYFSAHINLKSDYAPDRDGEDPVTMGYCPCEEAVGGELLPFNVLRMVVPYAIIGVAIIAVMASISSRKPRKIFQI